MLHSSLLVSSGRCGSFLSSSAWTPSAELTVKTAFFSACFFCTLSPHAARYHFHLPYLFSRQMWHPSLSGGSGILFFFILVFVGKNKEKGKDRENA
ncbi:hypothetical protein ACFX1W_032932 [Malus domestica]